MKLELKHLVGYLPYGLDIMIFNRVQPVYKTKLTPVFLADMTGVKPILHPLSDLTKEIEIGGKKFVPIDEIQASSVISDYYVENINNEVYLLANHRQGYNVLSPLNPLIKLYEWHFDIHNLIENDLAIDINTLKS